MRDEIPRRGASPNGRCPIILKLVALLFVADAQPQELIAFGVSHDDPAYIAAHADWIESRPFDGMVINEFFGRNLLNTSLKAYAPNALDSKTGAITYGAAAASLAPVKGVFRKFRENFAKVNFNMVGSPPLLNDAAGWLVVYESATNYARAVRDTGLKGIFFDNETYVRPAAAGRSNGIDYWLYEDQVALAGQSVSTMPLSAAIALARRRGRELMRAFTRGFPAITLIAAHGPSDGCDAWKSASGHFGMDRYLLGAFAAGMVEGTPGTATFVDGGEDYDLRSVRDFTLARDWRKGVATSAGGGITDPGARRCPFMDASLASAWQTRVSIAFSTFDKERPSLQSNHWAATMDVARFRTTLTNALRASDHYVWHYAEWQDWWGDTTEEALRPWIEAIEAARRDVASSGLPARPQG